MSPKPDLVKRSADLKRQLAAFAREPRFSGAFRRVFKPHHGGRIVSDESEAINLYDHFLLQHRLPDGRTVVDHFVEAHPELPEEERTMLLGWKDVVEGIFEVQRRNGQALIVRGLLDELTYRVRSNVGPDVFSDMPQGSFIIARLVPAGDEWLLSGMTAILPASQRDEVYRMTADAAPSLRKVVFRNPEKLEMAWELQRKQRVEFIAFFGSDLVVLRGAELRQRMQDFHHFRMYEVRDANGESPVDRARRIHGFEPELPDVSLNENICRAETVGVICDDVEGIHYWLDFGLVEEAFADPRLALDRQHKKAVLAYLEEPSISPLAFRWLGKRDPERASQVFRAVLKRPDFDWERDGEPLLRRYKASHFERPMLPTMTPVSGEMARAMMAKRKAESASASAVRAGPNDPCPCGSGKRYKRCCGRSETRHK